MIREGAAICSMVIGVALLGSCNEPDASRSYTPENSSTVEASSPPTVPASHRWDEVEGGTYYYIADLSEKERVEGKAAGSVIGFRYLGISEKGEHVILSVTSAGQPGNKSYCRNPCKIIKYEDGTRIAYTTNSVIGAAFEDAINGQLKEASDPRRENTNTAEANSKSLALTSILDSDRSELGMGCACAFRKPGGKEILIAGGDDKLIFRRDSERQICHIREGRLQEMFDGSTVLQCAGVTITIQEAGARKPGYDGHSVPARLTVNMPAGSTTYNGIWSCGC